MRQVKSIRIFSSIKICCNIRRCAHYPIAMPAGISKAIKKVFLCIGISVAVLAKPSVVAAQNAESSSIPLPSPELKSYLQSPEGAGTQDKGPVVAMAVKIKTVPKDSIFFDVLKKTESIEQPIQSAGELMILLEPKLTKEDVQAALEKYQVKIIRSLPEIGLVIVDVSKSLGNAAVPTAMESVSDAKASKLDALAAELSKDPRFLAVAPNSVISTFVIKSAMMPLHGSSPSTAALSERVDWGIGDVGFDDIWPLMKFPIEVGVVDIGFAKHEDIDAVMGLPGGFEAQNHGNHVAGIMCAKHNGIGVKGALRNCKVVESSAIRLMTDGNAPEGADESAFFVQIAEYMGTVLQFMERNPDVRVLNLSLGYNWMPNFNLDPRLQGKESVRNGIKAQARMFASVLAVAKARNIAIVMAAGNDSDSLEEPLEAEWASPFNYASRLMEKKDGWSNALIVEAHDRQQHRASFSNVGGDVSCPGVDVLSALASSENAYGELSGTSMASPYCAAGLAAVFALRPELSMREALGCMRGAPEKIDSRVPKFNARYAVLNCKKT